MKKILVLSVSLVAVFCLNAAEVPEKSEEYMATVEVLYTMRSGDTTTILVGDEELTFQGVHLELKEVGLNTAVAQYASHYSQLSTLLGLNTDLTKTVRTQVLSLWADVTSRTLIDGLAKQDALNLDYADSLSDEIYSQNQKYSALKTEQNKLQRTATQLNTAVGSVASSLSSLSEQMTQLQESQSAELTKVNEQLKALAQTSEQNKTDAMRAQEQSLKEYAAKLAIIEQSAGKARTTSQLTLTKISSLEAKVESLVSDGIYTKCWQDVSAWLGWYSVKSETNSGVFLPPPKFDAKDRTDGDYYKVEKGQSIFTQLSDAGIVPTLTEDGVTSWASLAGNAPKVYLKKGDEKKDGLTVEGDKKDDFLPIKDWIDGTTITINDEGKYTTDANVAKTLEAFMNKHKSSGIKSELKGAAEKKTDDNLWSTNNVLNPANPAFDKSNRNNIWNLLAYCGDSDVSPKDAAEGGGSTKALNSIQFLGSYSEAFGNAFSLYGFYKAKSGMFPYVDGSDTENTLLWKMELEGGSERNAYSSGSLPDTIEVVKVSDDDSEVVEAEKRRILSLKGFDTANVGQVAYKKSETELGWRTLGATTTATLPSAFGIVESYDTITNETTGLPETKLVSRRIVNRFYNIAGRSYHDFGESDEVSTDNGIYFYMKIDLSGGYGVKVDKCSTFEDIRHLQKDPEQYVIPLYYIDSFGSVLDLRTAPQVQAFETF